MKRDFENLNLRDALPAMPRETHEALMQAARSVREEEEPVRRKTFSAVLVAACIIVATMAAALAAGNIFGWNDFLSKNYGTAVPEGGQRVMGEMRNVKSFTLGDVTFTTRELYCDGYVALASTEARLADGAEGILTGMDPFEPMGIIGGNGEEAAARLGFSPQTTWAQAAERLGMPLYSVRAIIKAPAELSDGVGLEDPMYNEDGSVTYFSLEELNGTAHGETVDCQMYLRVEQVNPEDADQPIAVETAWEDISIFLEAPSDTQRYAVPEGIEIVPGLTLKSVGAELMPGGLYLRSTYEVGEELMKDEVYDALYGIDWQQADGEPFTQGLNLTSKVNVDAWPQVMLLNMVSAEEIPDRIVLTWPEAEPNIQLTLES